MTKPVGQKVEFFRHMVKHNRTIPILENLYGNDGYAVWFKTLEILGNNDGHYFDCSASIDWHWLAGDMCVDIELLESIYDTLAEIKAISAKHWKHRIIWSDNFVAQFEGLYSRRATEMPSPPPIPGKKNSSETTKPRLDPQEAADRARSKTSAARSDNQTNKQVTEELVELWNEANQRNLRYTAKKQKQVAKRLKTFSLEEIKKAVKNRAADQWIKDNDQGSNWDALFDEDDSVDQWLNRTPKGGNANSSAATVETLTITEAKQYAQKKRMDFNPSMFNKKIINGEERYIPNF
jgi:hypothetical protein